MTFSKKKYESRIRKLKIAPKTNQQCPCSYKIIKVKLMKINAKTQLTIAFSYKIKLVSASLNSPQTINKQMSFYHDFVS